MDAAATDQPQPGWSFEQWSTYWAEHPQGFEVYYAAYPGEAGLEYVAAVYEEIGAKADCAADNWESEELYQYWEKAAYGEAYWAYRKYEQQYNWPPVGIAV
jgi:hypothetical protein